MIFTKQRITFVDRAVLEDSFREESILAKMFGALSKKKKC
jgi:hypothetical protein